MSASISYAPRLPAASLIVVHILHRGGCRHLRRRRQPPSPHVVVSAYHVDLALLVPHVRVDLLDGDSVLYLAAAAIHRIGRVGCALALPVWRSGVLLLLHHLRDEDGELALFSKLAARRELFRYRVLQHQHRRSGRVALGLLVRRQNLEDDLHAARPKA